MVDVNSTHSNSSPEQRKRAGTGSNCIAIRSYGPHPQIRTRKSASIRRSAQIWSSVDANRQGAHRACIWASDRQAADAVRARIDWKYALSLELTDAGFNHTVLSEFRTRLVEGKLELVLLDVVLERVQALGLLNRRGKQPTDSTHILAAIAP